MNVPARSPRVLLVLVALAVAQACGPQRSPGDLLRDAVIEYNEGIRWQHYKSAALHVPPADRERFVAVREREADRIKVTDYEIVDVNHDLDAGEAKVTVEVEFHRLPSMTVQRLRLLQKWRLVGEVWLLEKTDKIEPDAESPPPEDLF